MAGEEASDGPTMQRAGWYSGYKKMRRRADAAHLTGPPGGAVSGNAIADGGGAGAAQAVRAGRKTGGAGRGQDRVARLGSLEGGHGWKAPAVRVGRKTGGAGRG